MYICFTYDSSKIAFASLLVVLSWSPLAASSGLFANFFFFATFADISGGWERGLLGAGDWLLWWRGLDACGIQGDVLSAVRVPSSPYAQTTPP